MRHWIDIVETEQFSKRKDLLRAIYRHIKQQVDSDMTWSEFYETYQELRQELRFPLKIYRALSFEGLDYFNAHDDDHHALDAEDMTVFMDGMQKIDFKKIGVCWTFDRAAAFSGGALGGGAGNHDGAHVIFETTIPASKCDILATMYHNLTVFQEEKEVRLKAHIPLTITSVTPNIGFKLPIRANSGPSGYYDTESIMVDLVQASKHHV